MLTDYCSTGMTWFIAVDIYFITLVGILPALPASENTLQDAIQRVCQLWWEKGLEGKEQLGKTLFVILLRKSLNKAATVC